MKFTNKSLYLIIYCIFFSVFLITCKKYPENNLWFKSASKAIHGDWNLTFFEINGNDSLNNNVKLISDKKISFTLTNSNKLFLPHRGGDIKIIGDGNFIGGWTISKNKKEIEISFTSKYENVTNVSYCPCYNLQNIFAAYKTKIIWKIEKLSRREFWISTTYNNLNYELHFKK
jgi:hypothetical protein